MPGSPGKHDESAAAFECAIERRRQLGHFRSTANEEISSNGRRHLRSLQAHVGLQRHDKRCRMRKALPKVSRPPEKAGS